MSKPILIGGVETFSMVDYPGQMAAVVFMQGCPWRCPFCHNKTLQKIGLETNFDWSKFKSFLVERKGKLDAVVFSGGEPLVQDALLDAIKEVKAMGYKIGLHSGGFRPDLFKQKIGIRICNKSKGRIHSDNLLIWTHYFRYYKYCSRIH